MRLVRKKSIYLLMISFLASCATPNPVIRLTPHETKTTWENGKEFTSYIKDGYIVHCAYHGTTDTYLVFDVEVINTTDNDFLVSPEKIVMYTDSGRWDLVKNQVVYNNFPIFAADPEFEILKNDLALSQLKASQKNHVATSVALGTLTLPVLVATASADARDAQQHAITRTEIAAAAAETTLNFADYSQEMNNIRSEFIYSLTDAWINNSLRKTTVSKNESVRGLVYFKRFDLTKCKDLRVDVPIGENSFISFSYKVNLYYPSSQNANPAYK